MPSMPVDADFLTALTVYGFASISMRRGSVCDQVSVGELLDVHKNVSANTVITKIESVRVLSKQFHDENNNLAVVVRVGS